MICNVSGVQLRYWNWAIQEGLFIAPVTQKRRSETTAKALLIRGLLWATRAWRAFLYADSLQSHDLKIAPLRATKYQKRTGINVGHRPIHGLPAGQDLINPPFCRYFSRTKRTLPSLSLEKLKTSPLPEWTYHASLLFFTYGDDVQNQLSCPSPGKIRALIAGNQQPTFL